MGPPINGGLKINTSVSSGLKRDVSTTSFRPDPEWDLPPVPVVYETIVDIARVLALSCHSPRRGPGDLSTPTIETVQCRPEAVKRCLVPFHRLYTLELVTESIHHLVE